MRHLNVRKSFLLAILTALAITMSTISRAQIVDASGPDQAPAANQPAAAAQAQPTGAPQICGNQPLCYESADFAATITHFRTSVVNNYHVMDVTMRFQNKTQQQLILGYVVSSGVATDDRGNRSIVGGANGYHGIGLVAGGNFDPKFVVRPAGFGDAQFELVLQGWPQVIGFTYALDLAVAEINSFEGNQHTLGEEYPIHFDGLQNGAGAASPMFARASAFGSAGSAISNPASALSNPCATVGSLGQGAGQAASTVSNAATAISNLGSMFHHKKTANPGQATNAVGCDPNAAGVPATAAVTTNGAGAPTTLTNPLQQAASRTAVPQATTNPVNPLASTPVKSVPATATRTTQTTPARSAVASAANAQTAVTARSAATAAPVNATKPAAPVAPVKPSPAKPAKQQTQAQKNAPANANSK
ncbi:MAG: hypothetical protein DMG97_01790 [Acidobacteria bacterium]|nr:MAG: hypothetical protein DMG97_01790 [Acidobacteriota bacterium]